MHYTLIITFHIYIHNFLKITNARDYFVCRVGASWEIRQATWRHFRFHRFTTNFSGNNWIKTYLNSKLLASFIHGYFFFWVLLRIEIEKRVTFWLQLHRGTAKNLNEWTKKLTFICRGRLYDVLHTSSAFLFRLSLTHTIDSSSLFPRDINLALK